MKLSGRTIDGSPVLTGVAEMTCTHGIPLEIVLSEVKARGAVVDWCDYISGCKGDGHNRATIRARILAGVGDVFGGEYVKQFEPHLDMALSRAFAN